MCEAVRQRAVVSEQQQAGGGEIQTPDTDPTTVMQGRQMREARLVTGRIAPRANHAGRLVIHQHPRRRVDPRPYRFAIDPDQLGTSNTLTECRQVAVDLDAPGTDPRLDFAA